ncbi:hypothetical protein HPB48_004418 [Haemaphysalis longicornis]|uniref:Uncharacterized protein n=1 Tax=Haemaphysalis longicornis TaxID=44386 RepID=A0A9J6FY71_HAELO|nr:hypothetical protein HPB48_004418 [Haemaphysalis longicornis]
MIVQPEHEEADLIPNQDLVRLIKHTSECAPVRKRQEIMERDEYYNLMRMTNAEQHEILREIIHPAEDTISTSKFVLRLPMDLYNRQSNTGNNTTYNAFIICASTGKATVVVGGTTVHATLELSRKTTGRNKDEGLSASELNTFRVAFRYVNFVIIDEDYFDREHIFQGQNVRYYIVRDYIVRILASTIDSRP